jgi:hypothetical protein
MNPPRLVLDHPDRILDLEVHIESTLNFLMDDCVAAGWEVDEARQAVLNIAEVFKARHEAYQCDERRISEERKKSAN